MAFDKTKLYKISSNFSGMKIWGYDAGADTAATVDTAGYFNAVAKDLEVGDEIRVMSSSGTVWKRMLVNSNSGGVVDVTDGETIPMTDTD